MKEVRLITPEDISKHLEQDVIDELKKRVFDRFQKPKKSKFQYSKFERQIKLFHDIADLHYFDCTLPEPPPIEYFTNYGLDPKDQVYRRDKMPDSLAKIDREVKYGAIKRNDAISAVLGNEEAVTFIESCWYKRLTGDWQLINGNPTYISRNPLLRPEN